MEIIYFVGTLLLALFSIGAILAIALAIGFIVEINRAESSPSE
ncbi:MAG: hypothetical protein RLZ28_870 [Actinomycetota bacterium]|jgi:uncharacterized membrane protein